MGVIQSARVCADLNRTASPALHFAPESAALLPETIRKKEEFVGLRVEQVKELMGLDDLPGAAHNDAEVNSAFAQAFIKALERGIQVKFWGAVPYLMDEKYKIEKQLVFPRLMALQSTFNEFAKEGDTTQAAVDKLFAQVNGKLWEMSDLRHEQVLSKRNELPVVLGGKPHRQGTIPHSISETMVDMLLAEGAQHVITASRHNVEECDRRITHIFGLDLFGRPEDYIKVIDIVYEKWKALSSLGLNKIVFYFTLGGHGTTFHDRVKAAQNNIKAADGLSAALKDLPQQFPTDKVTIVVTGTDATNPSTTHPVTGVPVYKIGNPNFFYAMSKLAQEHILAVRVLEMNNQTAPPQSSKDLQWMKERISALSDATDLNKEGFENAEYKERLDRIAEEQDWMQAVYHFRVVKHLSIIFSSMHSPTFVKQAEKAAVPAVSVLCNIVDRLKNAVALKEAALMHLLRQETGSSVVLTPSDNWAGD